MPRQEDTNSIAENAVSKIITVCNNEDIQLYHHFRIPESGLIDYFTEHLQGLKTGSNGQLNIHEMEN